MERGGADQHPAPPGDRQPARRLGGMGMAVDERDHRHQRRRAPPGIRTRNVRTMVSTTTDSTSVPSTAAVATPGTRPVHRPPSPRRAPRAAPTTPPAEPYREQPDHHHRKDIIDAPDRMRGAVE